MGKGTRTKVHPRAQVGLGRHSLEENCPRSTPIPDLLNTVLRSGDDATSNSSRWQRYAKVHHISYRMNAIGLRIRSWQAPTTFTENECCSRDARNSQLNDERQNDKGKYKEQSKHIRWPQAILQVYLYYDEQQSLLPPSTWSTTAQWRVDPTVWRSPVLGRRLVIVRYDVTNLCQIKVFGYTGRQSLQD